MPSTKAWLSKPENQAKVKASRKAWAERNKDKEALRVKEKNKRFIRNNPNYHKDRSLKQKYGITYQDYVTLYNEQEGKCGICSIFLPLESKIFTEILNVDHCHSSGKVRGLLCHRCNKALGLFDDNTSTLEQAMRYLRK